MSALSTSARHEYYLKLGGGLPPPVPHNQENHERRLTTAIETFEDLRPGDAYEASLAVTIVLSGAHAVECLREAGVYHDDYAKRARCRAQASSMMRAENSAKRTLEREQKVRLVGEAVARTVRGEPVAGAPQPVPLEVEPLHLDVAQDAGAAVPAPAGSAPPPSPEAIAQAETYTHKNIMTAAQIRHDGGVTPENKAYFRHLTLPSDPAVIDALVRGVSDTLRLLD
jgi:hypothetical protein